MATKLFKLVLVTRNAKNIATKLRKVISKNLEISDTSKNFEFLNLKKPVLMLATKLISLNFKEGDMLKFQQFQKVKVSRCCEASWFPWWSTISRSEALRTRTRIHFWRTRKVDACQGYANGRPNGIDRITVKNLKVVQINPEAGLIMVREQFQVDEEHL
jgi:hypothetical protein